MTTSRKRSIVADDMDFFVESDDDGRKQLPSVYDDTEEHVDDDYIFARNRYRDLVEKSEEAIDVMLDLARDSEHPRAFEVLSTMMKQNAEITDRLIELHKSKKELKAKKNEPTAQSLTQNNVFLGSTEELQRFLIQQKNK